MSRPPPTAQELARREAAAAEARAFAGDSARRARLQAFGAALETLGERNLQNRNTHARLGERLLADVRARRAFSLLRLGDGEGNLLFWDAHRLACPALAGLSMERILRLMFGQRMPARAHWDRLAALVVEAVENASYAGLPTPKQTFSNLDALALARAQDFDLRGTSGVVAVWDWLEPGAAQWLGDPGRVVVNWHVHSSLLGFAPALVRAAGNVSLVTCYPELLGRMQSAFGVERGESFLIPPQAGNIRGTPEDTHYPDTYAAIAACIGGRARAGELFLVGAGILGKTYCELVRRAGGMAIDMGSMLDVWMGIGVRVYQNERFVAEHRLGGDDGPAVSA
jgi:hypothetical protein